jgi:hypothetical protein
VELFTLFGQKGRNLGSLTDETSVWRDEKIRSFRTDLPMATGGSLAIESSNKKERRPKWPPLCDFLTQRLALGAFFGLGFVFLFPIRASAATAGEGGGGESGHGDDREG